MSTSVRHYSRGRKLVAMRDVQAGNSRYYHYDHQGTTQCLTDGSGNVTDRFAADAWGVQVKRTGSSINRHWYIGNAGYYCEQIARLKYIRARLYREALGRWLSRDPVPFPSRFSYGSNSPSIGADPSGREWVVGSFRYEPPLNERDDDPERTFGSWKKKAICLEPARPGDCELGVWMYAAFADLMGTRLFGDQVVKYAKASGGTMHLSVSDMDNLLARSAADSSLLARKAREAAAFLETYLLENGCARSVGIYHRGKMGTPKVTFGEHLDLYMAIGGHQAYGSAVGSCTCLEDGSIQMRMSFSYRVLDVALYDGSAFNMPGGGTIDPFPFQNPRLCHLCGWYKDFWVKGLYNKVYMWTVEEVG